MWYLIAIRHAADNMPTIIGVRDVRSRWIGHRLYAEADIVVDDTMTVRDGQTIAQQFRKVAMSHLPALNALRIEFVRPAIKTHEDAHRRVQGDHEHGIDVDAPISPTC